MFIFDFLAAIGIGLLGSTHCLGMCGGINSLMVVGSGESKQSNFRYIPLFNFGRICSYTIAGLALGSVSFAIQSLNPNIMAVTKLVSGFLLFTMACYIGRWWLGLTRIEALMGKMWPLIQPLVSHFIPVTSPFSAFKLGALWGWMPCGLVYSTLSWAILAQDPLRSGLLMFGFGLGTLPSMLAAGYFAKELLLWVRKKWVRNISALCLLLFSFWVIYTGIQPFISDQPMHHHSI